MKFFGAVVLSILAIGCSVSHRADAADWPVIPAADAARLKARVTCSCLFVQKLSLAQCSDGAPAIWRYPFATAGKLLESPNQTLSVVQTPAGGAVRILSGESVLAESHYLDDGGGCVTGAAPKEQVSNSVPRAQVESVPLSRAELPRSVDARAVDQALASGFSAQGPLGGFARAAFIMLDGQVVAERYAPGFGPETEYYFGSVAKVFNNLLAGLLVQDGKLHVKDTVNLPEWQQKGDARAAITFDQMLHMTSGIEWDEDFFHPGAPAYEVYFGGAGGTDVASLVAARSLEAKPGTHFEYSTGAATLLAHALQRRIGESVSRAALLQYFSRQLFTPLGIDGITLEFDPAGTFLSGHAAWGRPEDLARIGLMYMNDGKWQQRRVLPEGWVGYSTQPGKATDMPAEPYGAQLMLDMAGVPGCFGHRGVGGQFLIVCPKRGLVLVWFSSLFDFATQRASRPEETLRQLIQAFPEGSRP
jgi:CubicO group peptidase (beta-lactamase class C family)